MKTITLLLIFVTSTSQNSYAGNLDRAKKIFETPTANAGSDKTIYLNQTNSVVLNGSGTGTQLTYQWTEISSDYMSGAIITNPNNNITEVRGLPQGVFYFRLTVTDNIGQVASDSIKINVNFDAPPLNSTIAKHFPLDRKPFWDIVNNRDDTTKYLGYNETYSKPHYAHSLLILDGNEYLWLERSRNNGMMVDSLRGKFYTTLEDGYQWNFSGYARSQVNFGNYFLIDTNKTYIWEWKIYFPQPVAANMQPIGDPDWGRVTMWDIHGLDDESGQFGITLSRNALLASDRYKVIDGTGAVIETPLINTSDMYNQTHTIRIIYREGSAYPGQKAFIKVDVDGVQKYFRNTGKVGKTLMQDYNKTTGLYDYNNLLVDANNHTRNKKFSLVTESAEVYQLNNKPTVDAGIDKTITGSTITLYGNANDLGVSGNGTIITYQWTKISGGSANIISPNSGITNITGLTNGSYIFQLKVTDNSGIQNSDTVKIIVNNIQNFPPIANAGNDQTITIPSNNALLSGSGNDINGMIISYNWQKISGPSSYNISAPSSASTTVSGLVQGIYLFELTVTDNNNAIGKDTVQVKVMMPNNVGPIANAGADIIITLPLNTISLKGTGNDIDGAIKGYQWTKVSGPSFFNILNPSSQTTDVTGLVVGTYLFVLTVVDDKGDSDKDTIQVKVNAANKAPHANAGSDKTIFLPTNVISLNGSGTDEDGTIISYKWIKISGPSSYNIVNPSLSTTDVSGLITGIYLFELSVTDNNGAIGKDTVQVTIKSPPNILPIANAGLDKTITLPINISSLAGSGSDADGTITSYKWGKISGPTAYNIVNPFSPVTDVFGLVEGIYFFELTVTDNSGGIGKDTVKIIVSKEKSIAPIISNIPPIANAGNDTIVIAPIDLLTLKGSGIDTDGKIISYLWNQVSGPNTIDNLPNNTPTVNISNLKEGIYKFELTVTDNSGGIGKDTIEITVALARLSREANSINFYPNSVRDIGTLDINIGKANTELAIAIADMNGKIVYKKQLVSTSNSIKEKIDMRNLTVGTYIATVFFNNVEKQSIKLIKL